MQQQRHIIKRQVIELEIKNSGQAQMLQDEVSRIYRQRLVPLIDQCCSELSEPGRLHRIESLELDIGTLDSRTLEEQLVDRVRTALRRELAAQIHSQDQKAGRAGESPKAQSQLELFIFFARTGSLPWWADSSIPNLLAENLEQLLHEAAGPLWRQLQALAREQHIRQRMVNQYTDEQLAHLAGLLVPAFGIPVIRDLQELGELLQKSGQPPRFRQSLWNIILQVAALGGTQYPTPEAFTLAVLKRVASTLGHPVDVLLANLHQAAVQEKQANAAGRLRNIIERLASPNTQAQTGKKQNKEIVQRLAQLQPAVGPLSAAWDELMTFAGQLPAVRQAAWLAALRKLGGHASMQETLECLIELLQSIEPAPRGRRGEEISRLAGMLRAGLLDAKTEYTAADKDPENPLEKTAVDLHFSETDELSVGNAGLVILWPFLTGFFTRLGLVEDRQFKDPAARQRGAGLLQVIAAQQADPAEYLLPLNKLLCGMELAEVFDFGGPLLDPEMQECTDLLEATISQASILHDMSVDGFRGTFLLRPGMLSARDGFWLLRVERETYDVVLERFPWNWEWVKLPWMEAPLRVEW